MKAFSHVSNVKGRKMVTLGDSKVSFIPWLSTPPSFVTCGTRVWEHGQKTIGFLWVTWFQTNRSTSILPERKSGCYNMCTTDQSWGCWCYIPGM